MHRTPSNFPLRPPHLLALAFSAAVLLGGADPVAGQTGSVTGQLVDRTTGEPLESGQVQIEETAQGTLTDARGRFLLTGLPEGTHTLRAMHIGYRTETREVEIRPGQAVEADFELAMSAVALDEMVVTGTGGDVERQRVGASIASVDAGQVREAVPVQDLGNTLQGRLPGVRSIGTVGGVGTSRELKIRGTSSFQLGQRPVIYIDGVRVDTRHVEWGWMEGVTCCFFSGGAGEDRLGDLNPADIERIEVLKGAAATTLYGSEATNGVIQIFTRTGATEASADWSLGAGVGINRHRPNFQTKLFPNFTGPEGFRALDANEALIENGLIHDYDLSVRGGGENVTYFVSGSYLNEEGSLQPNWQKRGNLRLNLRFLPHDDVSIETNSAYHRNRILSLQSGNNWTSLLGNAILGNPREATEDRPFGEPWVNVEDIKEMETYSDASRWTGGVTVRYTPSQDFSHRMTLGLDAVSEEKDRLLPYGHFYVYAGTEGEKNIGYRNFRSFTADYLGQFSFDLTDALASELSWGAQGFWETERVSMATGQEYAGPGVTVVGGAARSFGDEGFEEVVNIGLFAQNRFALRDRLFLTAGVRVDGNSAFGVDYGLQPYPKLDASYVLSRDAFVPEWISSLRVRAAVGRSGMFPGAFDQFRTFEPVAVLQDEAGVTPANPGNPDLKPETTTEIEAGFEAGLFEDRVGIDFTAYRSTTEDALLDVPLPPSMGFDDAQLRNAGRIRNVGFEVSLNSMPVDSRAFRWTTDVNVDYNENEILSLGDAAQEGQLGNHREGYAVGAIFARDIEDYDPDANTHTRTDTAVFRGKPEPNWNFGWSNDVRFGAFRVHALLTAEKGAIFSNSDRPYRIRFQTGDEYLATLDENGEETARSDSLRNYYTLVSAYDSRNNVRLQELSVSYLMPDGLVSVLGLGRTTLTLSGQNLHWWDDCNCMDPNMRYRGGMDFNYSGFLAMPQARRFMFSVRTNF